jgi:hypothetical protein
LKFPSSRDQATAEARKVALLQHRSLPTRKKLLKKLQRTNHLVCHRPIGFLFPGDLKNRVARFFLTQSTKTGGKCTKLPQHYLMAIECTKWPLNIPNGYKIYQHFSFKGPPKFTQIGIFGLKKIPSGNPASESLTLFLETEKKNFDHFLAPKIRFQEKNETRKINFMKTFVA